MKDKFYLTTSIAYTNAPPHLGFALETIQADVIARYVRSKKKEVFFLTGVDEHGRKVAEAALKAGQSEKEFTDKISSQFKRLTQVLNLSNDDFIRTSDQKRHWPAVVKVWQELEKRGDIYKKKYKGLYCLGCEAFITKKDLKDGLCPIHKKAPEIIEEENYFFRLSRYTQRIKEIIEKDIIKIIPLTRKREMLGFLKQGLEDISFSRPRKDLKWAIPVPGDPEASIYVWADALTNYLSLIGYVDEPKTFKKFWPADIHFIGKDIQKFHCLIWPGMLLSLGLSLPKIIFVHGFITVAGEKMSKSLGNVVDPFQLVEKYGTDPVRYFLLREIPATADGDFTEEKFILRYNSDLAKGLGNLVARLVTLEKKFKIKVGAKVQNSEIQKKIDNLSQKYEKALEEYKLNEALTIVWQLISFCDKLIEREKLWEGGEMVADLLVTLKVIAQWLEPFLPKTSTKIMKQIKNQESQSLFPRF